MQESALSKRDPRHGADYIATIVQLFGNVKCFLDESRLAGLRYDPPHEQTQDRLRAGQVFAWTIKPKHRC
jgi:hypothetical protein